MKTAKRKGPKPPKTPLARARYFGRIGGQASGGKKAKTARANGKLGGRPPGKKKR